jgi:hypothetical protein
MIPRGAKRRFEKTQNLPFWEAIVQRVLVKTLRD